MASTSPSVFSIRTLSERLVNYRPPEPGPEMKELRPAAVLAPLFQRGGQWQLLLHRRPNHSLEHPGEVAFPGGKLEASDPDLVYCALREANEEMGIAPNHVTVLGQLDPVNTRTGYLMYPVVGLLPNDYHFQPNDQEVDILMEVALDWLFDEHSLRYEARMQSDGTLLRRYTYVSASHLIFGATALILGQLLTMASVKETPNGGASVPISRNKEALG
jgi:8-oxo-dGTP pyrophosphatase MutT (NUDIX family)